MNENRKDILELLATGKITADEAERLIRAMEETSEEIRTKPKYLRVLVESDQENSPTKVNVRVPLNLLRAGVKLANLIPTRAKDEINSALQNEGINFDITKISSDNVEELITHLTELTVDVEESKNKVRVFCE